MNAVALVVIAVAGTLASTPPAKPQNPKPPTARDRHAAELAAFGAVDVRANTVVVFGSGITRNDSSPFFDDAQSIAILIMSSELMTEVMREQPTFERVQKTYDAQYLWLLTKPGEKATVRIIDLATNEDVAISSDPTTVSDAFVAHLLPRYKRATAEGPPITFAVKDVAARPEIAKAVAQALAAKAPELRRRRGLPTFDVFTKLTPMQIAERIDGLKMGEHTLSVTDVVPKDAWLVVALQ